MDHDDLPQSLHLAAPISLLWASGQHPAAPPISGYRKSGNRHHRSRFGEFSNGTSGEITSGGYIVFMSRYLAALFPVPPLSMSFTPSPFWVPLDGEETLATFASDLAVKHIQLVATLAVGPEMRHSQVPLQP